MTILSPVENQAAGSAISCCSLLLQLSGVIKKENIMAELKNLPLKKAVKHFGQAHNVRFKFEKVKRERISQNDLPLAFRQKMVSLSF